MKYTFISLFLAIQIGCQNNPHGDVENHPVRNAHSMVYHSQDSLVYVFGGADERQVLGDLLVLKDRSWRKVIANTSPQPRTFASMCYDTKHDRVILFGGSKVLFGIEPDQENLLNDTWQYKDSEWQQISINSRPKARAEMAMAYDENRNVTVLFGGYTIEKGEYVKLGDTWELHDNEWHLMSKTGPTQRNGASMVYHPKDETVLLFGGSTVDRQYGNGKGETWQWDGKEWYRLQIEQPSGVYNTSMSYDMKLESIVRFGGWNGTSRIDETWMFDGITWKQVQMEDRPAPRNHSEMIYDEKRKEVVLFGGHDGQRVFSDLWLLKDGKWTELISSEPTERIDNGH